MDIIFLLIPVALILVVIIIWVFFWAVKSDQFEDLEGPAHRIIMDKEEIIEPDETRKKSTRKDNSK